MVASNKKWLAKTMKGINRLLKVAKGKETKVEGKGKRKEEEVDTEENGHRYIEAHTYP